MSLALAIALSYVLGSIPTGLWLGRAFKGIDIREHGSKNIGATNTLRVLGKGFGALALLGDAGKGLAAVFIGQALSGWEQAPLICGVTAIAGHSASLFCRFKGGKGVATSAGVFLALCPLPVLIASVVFAAVAAATRMVSAASLSAALTLAIAIFFFPASTLLRVLVVAVCLLVIVRHRSNIQRILKGEENRL